MNLRVKRWILVAVCVILFIIPETKGQKIGVKTNLLTWATTSLNIGLEFGTGVHSTINLFGSYNPFEFSSTKKLKHWVFMPEYRYWTCERFNGSFFGVHMLGGKFNVGGIKLPWGIFSNLEKYRYQGWGIGGGLTYGYQWLLGKHWNLEASIGAGYAYLKYDKFPCAECGERLDKGVKHYFGVTKAAISLIYLF